MSGSVTYEVQQNCAVIIVTNPPVNALSQAIRQGIQDAIVQFNQDDSAHVAVMVGHGRLFLGGADITEFGKPPQPPSLPDVINQIEASEKPVVVVVHGAALGGGLEVALGAHYRIGLAGTKLGLPEVHLGLIPGAGATQRLPRLIGIDGALSMITSGQPISAAKALELGVIDVLSEQSDPKAAGLAYAQRLLQEKAPVRRISDMPMVEPNEALLDEWRAKMRKAAKGQVAQLTAIDAVAKATELPLLDGFAEERKLFMKLMDTPQRSGLIHAFFSERKVSKLPELASAEPQHIESVGIIGGGTMGAGIATAALLNGLQLTLIERDQAAVDKAWATIDGYLQAGMKRGKLSAEGYQQIVEKQYQGSTDYAALAQCDLVIEAVFEDMQVKKTVFKTLDDIVKSGAILASNTSYLDINEIASVTKRPEAVIGLHFFSPAHIMKLLEVVVADKTHANVVASAFALAKRLGKTPVKAGVCDGFIGNRILAHYRTAADHMVLDGASPYQVDTALTNFGFAMGPYAVSDLAGLDIGFATRQRKAATRHPLERVPTFADTLYHLGRLGQKTGSGYYRYEPGNRVGQQDPIVEEAVNEARQQAGTVARDFTDEDIVKRYMAAMINEGARVLEEGIAARPLDIDITFLFGYGFPRWRGGPMHYADTYGLDKVLSDIQGFAEQDAHFWQVAPLLQKLVNEQRSFSSLNEQ